MEILKDAEFRKELKNAPRTGYLFFGDEDYLKSHALASLKERICPDPTYAFFNELKLDAIDYEPQKLLDALTPLPMMADFKLVHLSGLNFNTMRQNDLDALCEVLATLAEYDYNVLVISVAADALNAGYLPKRPSPTLAKLAEYLTPVQFDRCTTAKLASWVQKHFAHNGITVDAAFCMRFPDYCGHSMFILSNEIDKLSFYARSHGKDSVTDADMRLVCTPADEYDAFAFTNAIMESRPEAALAILADYKFRRVDPLMILGDVTRVICDMVAVRAMQQEGTPAAEIASILKLHEFKVGLYQKSLRQTSERRLLRALDACTDADRSLKSSSAGYAPLEELICKL